MSYRSQGDLHTALKTDVLGRVIAGDIHLALVRLQNGRDNFAYSLHARPSSFTISGEMQSTDFLAYLGFRRGGCRFLEGGDCYARTVDNPFDLDAFAQALPGASASFRQAAKNLEACGVYLNHPEGVGFFMGQPSEPRQYSLGVTSGDGHHAALHNRQKESEDQYFQYVLTWIDGGRDKGWTTHYRPKHPPLSPEMASAFSFLKFRTFDECPEFDFATCHWRFTPFNAQGNDIFGGNAGIAHRLFEANATLFSSGLEGLLSSNAAIKPFGLGFLPDVHLAPTPVAKSSRATQPVLQGRPLPTLPRTTTVAEPTFESFDVAISFAGTERENARQLAAMVAEQGFSVFFDEYYEEQLWGKDLVEYFDAIYRKNSRYCVLFVSGEYVSRMWTTHERRSAQARALQEPGYMLPIRVDDAELPGMPPTIAYLSLREKSIENIGQLLIQRLQR